MIDAIHFYRVKDLENVKNFYGKILGLPLYKYQKTCLIYCLKGHGKIGFCTHHPKNINDNTCITFVYETEVEVDKMYDFLLNHLAIDHAPVINPNFKIYHFFVKDFEGLTLEFQTFLK
jgi:catechol-2,3-dioxygenase